MSDSILDNTTEGNEWPEFVPDSMRTDEYKSLTKFKTTEDALKSYANLERRAGSMVKIPDDKASDEDWKAYEDKLGVPEKSEDYKFELGEDVNEDLLSKIKISGKQNRVPQAALKAVVEDAFKFMNEQNKTQQDELAKKAEEWSAATQETFKDDWETVKGTIQRHLKSDSVKGLDETTIKIMESTGLAHHPLIVRALLADAKLNGEKSASFPEGEGAGSMGLDKSAIRARIREITGDRYNPNLPYWNDRHPDHAKMVQREQELQKQLASE